MEAVLVAFVWAAAVQQDDPAGALVKEANTLYESGMLVEALERYEAVLKLSPKHANALFNGGLAAYRTGKPARAAELWRSRAAP